MIQKKLESFINGYLKANDLEIQNWHISSNKKQGFGDYSSNIALALSKQIGQNPMEIAEKIIASHDKDELLFSVSVTKPGFINFHISGDYYLNILKNILD